MRRFAADAAGMRIGDLVFPSPAIGSNLGDRTSIGSYDFGFGSTRDTKARLLKSALASDSTEVTTLLTAVRTTSALR